MISGRTQKLLGTAILLLAIAFLIVGFVGTHKAYDQSAGAFGILTFTRISDRELTEDATFSGVLRHGDRLVSTYDRTQPRGKRACPT